MCERARRQAFTDHVNEDCRLLPDTTVEATGNCVVCYHKGAVTAACIVKEDE